MTYIFEPITGVKKVFEPLPALFMLDAFTQSYMPAGRLANSIVIFPMTFALSQTIRS